MKNRINSYLYNKNNAYNIFIFLWNYVHLNDVKYDVN